MTFPSNQPARWYSEPERAIILNNVLASLSRRLAVTRFNMGVSAEIKPMYPTTSMVMVFLYGSLSIMTCGLWLPVWFILIMIAPKVRTVTINEWGYQISGTRPVSPGQRALSVAVGIATLMWIILVMIIVTH